MKTLRLLLLLLAGSASVAFAQNPNFSNTTPAPPSGGVNCLWQHDSATPVNLSCYIPSGTYDAAGAAAAALASAQTVFGPSGTGHAKGMVPDPGATAGTTRFLREDGGWQVPSGSGSGGSGTVNSGSAFAPAYYPGTGTAVSGATPFNGVGYFSTTAAPVTATAAQIASFAKNVIYASAGNSTLGVAACALNTNINSGGGTADDPCLQADLDALGTAGGGTLYINGYALLACSKYGTTNSVDGNVQTTALQTHSNIKIDATGGGVFLQANSNCTMLGNNISGNVTASGWQTNMSVVGGIWNGNGTNIANQSRYEANVSTNWWNMGFWFGGFNGLILRDVTVRNATTFAITLSNGTNFTILNPTTTWDAVCTITNCNDDGIHLWGTLTKGYVSNWLSVNNDDDVFAANTDEGVYLPSVSSYANSGRFPASGGSLNNITVDTAYWSNTKHSARWYGVPVTGGVATLSDIALRNITGAPTTTAMLNSGITGSIRLNIEDWHMTGSYNGINVPTTTNLALTNLDPSAAINVNGSTPWLLTSPGVVQVNGINVCLANGVNCNGSLTPPSVRTTCNNLITSSVSSISCTLTASAGDAAVMFFGDTTPVSSVTDSGGATASVITTTGGVWMWSFANLSAGSHTFTINFVSPEAYPLLYVSDIAGAVTAAPVDTFSTNTTSVAGTTFTSNSATIAQAGELLVGVEFNGANATATTSSPTFTSTGAIWGGNAFAGYYSTSATGSYALSGTLGASATYTAAFVAIK